jgi:hypothetical protein
MFTKTADIPTSSAKIVPHDDPQVKKIKEDLSSGKKIKKSL